jgi:LPXTG-site transpeptidase (sortase) family protein
VSLSIYTKEPKESYDLLNRAKRNDRIFSSIISLVGVFSILFAVLPILIWNLKFAPLFKNNIGEAPVPQGLVLGQNAIEDIQVVRDADGFSFFKTDYKPSGNRPKNFYISIPKLKIENATVDVDTLVFYDNLSHFPGSALPGEVGNVFITGHSVLPQFTDTKNYNTIFSKLPELEIGDVIDVNLNGKYYQYVVQYKKIVDPKDLSVLSPISKSAKNLTLMTCVPPGTSLQRMVVITSLI